jgi:fructose-1,6-bisphosphatase/inositol monophosphatase family enzyme
VRDTLSPENYMAAYLIVAEAGGTVSDRYGKPLGPIHSMTQGQSIVAAATPALHAAILEALGRTEAEG